MNPLKYLGLKGPDRKGFDLDNLSVGDGNRLKTVLFAILGRNYITTDTGTNYTYRIEDGDGWKRHDNASPISAIVPPESSVAFRIGQTITVEQAGAGQLTLVEGTSDVTINTPETLSLRAQFSVATLVKVGTDEWTLIGDLETA